MCEFINFLRIFYWEEKGKIGLNRLHNRATFLQRPKIMGRGEKRVRGFRNAGQNSYNTNNNT